MPRVPPGTPVPPSEEECELYYYGFPSCPRLVARSSFYGWVNPLSLDRTTSANTTKNHVKSLRPVGRHPALSNLWNRPASALKAQIMEAVKRADHWTAVDLYRIAMNGGSQVTLMIAVAPRTLSWNDGYRIVMQCKSIFEAHDIYDVECEIRESAVRRDSAIRRTLEYRGQYL